MEQTIDYIATEAHQTNGRTPPALPTITLVDSGYTVEFRSLGPRTMQTLDKAARKGITKPTPPLNEVIGLNGKPAHEPNPADPAYEAALAEYVATVNERMTDLLFALIARQCIATPVDSDAVQRVRTDFADIGLDAPTDDRDLFLNHVLIGSTRDLVDLQNAILRRSLPTEEAIREKAAEFPGDVQGA